MMITKPTTPLEVNNYIYILPNLLGPLTYFIFKYVNGPNKLF
ncbi:hypothetical protein CBO05C_2045 [Clostridium botulinum B str. Osaka05]|uniref:Uncharacterized protein n=1 Tax=Clostridium botulinum B str. Osaka05 TaxID=1407017 RepID=A0A0S6U1Y5_CLOBO|nr:hypothetical protein CBO05C_2045 [Clostridium botulinum B str. Osaka05]